MVLSTLTAVLCISIGVAGFIVILRVIALLIKPALLIAVGIFIGMALSREMVESHPTDLQKVKITPDDHAVLGQTDRLVELAGDTWTQSLPYCKASFQLAAQVTENLVAWVKTNFEDFSMQDATKLALRDQLKQREALDQNRHF